MKYLAAVSIIAVLSCTKGLTPSIGAEGDMGAKLLRKQCEMPLNIVFDESVPKEKHASFYNAMNYWEDETGLNLFTFGLTDATESNTLKLEWAVIAGSMTACAVTQYWRQSLSCVGKTSIVVASACADRDWETKSE